MESIDMKAYAKINTVLDIKGVFEEGKYKGYHRLDMIMLSVGLYDRLRLSKRADGEIRLFEGKKGFGLGKNNLVYKAIELMRERFDIKEGVTAELEKRIPSSAGLGGGSADCAAALRGMVKLFDIDIKEAELFGLGESLGADVPFCLCGKPARAEGIGEVLTAVPDFPPCSVLLAKPKAGAPTPVIFKAYDSLSEVSHPDCEKMIALMKKGNLKEICAGFGNVLEEVTIKKLPVVGELKKEMFKEGALGVLMSGSGSCVFGIFEKEAEAERACRRIRGKFDLDGAFVTEILPRRVFL